MLYVLRRCNGAQSKDIPIAVWRICIIRALINEFILAKRTAKVNLLRLKVTLNAPCCATLQVVYIYIAFECTETGQRMHR